MAIFTNKRQGSPISSVEFAPQPEGNLSFFHVNPGTNVEDVKAWLSSSEVGQEVLAQSKVGGHDVLVTRGDKSQNDVINIMAARGEQLKLAQEPKKFNAWKMRGNMSNAGQLLQLFSGATSLAVSDAAKGKPPKTLVASDFVKKGMDGPTMAFAGLNLFANTMNVLFGAGKDRDVHQEKFIKEKLNGVLSPHVTDENAGLPGTGENRLALRSDPEKTKSFGEKINATIKKNSVVMGEIIPRFVGAIALVIPVKNIKPTVDLVKQGVFQKGALNAIWKAAANSDKGTRNAGLAYLGGKTLALFSKVPDPYNTEKPHTALDTFREKYVFKISSGIELIAAGMLAKDRFFNPTRKISVGGKTIQDYAGGIGGALFATGLMIRIFAPFGVKEVNMDEIKAHVTDGLANCPPEKLPQLMADTAASLKDHFKDQPLEFGKLYTQMSTDLYRYHNIAANSNLPVAANDSVASMQSAEAPAEVTNTRFATEALKKTRPAMSFNTGANHQERLAATPAGLSQAL